MSSFDLVPLISFESVRSISLQEILSLVSLFVFIGVTMFSTFVEYRRMKKLKMLQKTKMIEDADCYGINRTAFFLFAIFTQCSSFVLMCKDF